MGLIRLYANDMALANDMDCCRLLAQYSAVLACELRAAMACKEGGDGFHIQSMPSVADELPVKAGAELILMLWQTFCFHASTPACYSDAVAQGALYKARSHGCPAGMSRTAGCIDGSQG